MQAGGVVDVRPGCIVDFRGRQWVLLESGEESWKLRPLTGGADDVVAVHKELSRVLGAELEEERLKLSLFPLPSPDDVLDLQAVRLFWRAARLTLREAAAPFRSFGKISVRPRRYQLVPLMMALKLDPVRLFIADDVGVGKTIEALLIAREMMERGEVRRMAVLCPPYLCEQWEKELREKFNFEPVVLRSGTIGRLEREVPRDASVFSHYPVLVISIDWVKSERYRHVFLKECPELVIVDEVHGAAQPHEGRNSAQQQRHRLLCDIAKDERRHLILLTATPHSGIDSAFRSLIGLLDADFGRLDVELQDKETRKRLALHFVQRTRKDIEKMWGEERCFPERESKDEPYELCAAYAEFFDAVNQYCLGIVEEGLKLAEHKRRMHWWSALSLLRCVMSSPAAACAALERRMERVLEDGEPGAGAGGLLDSDDEEHVDDEVPLFSSLFPREAEEEARERELAKLRDLLGKAKKLLRSRKKDAKFEACVKVVRDLLDEDLNPIIWCRYVATAEYVRDRLAAVLGEGVQVVLVTGRLSDEERRVVVEQVDPLRPRVLVATDCLSEGINLQEKFSSVVHYDLPWNPNRLEQREGRVDRYGQRAPRVIAVCLYGTNNRVDQAVVEVLLRKAREIRRVLGVHVPVPRHDEGVVDALVETLFLEEHQARLGFTGGDSVDEFRNRWESSVEQERKRRNVFAQAALKPEEVDKELEATDSVLGTEEEVEKFVLEAAQRLRLHVRKRRTSSADGEVYVVAAAMRDELPPVVRAALPAGAAEWNISFVSPTPACAEYVGRNHPFVSSMACHILERGLLGKEGARSILAARCGVVRTDAVSRLTALLLLRLRYLMEIPERAPLMAEEVVVMGARSPFEDESSWLEPRDALELFDGLESARGKSEVPPGERKELLASVIDELRPFFEEGEGLKPLRGKLEKRAGELEESHRRIRRAAGMKGVRVKFTLQLPPDLLGMVLLQPVVGGGR